MSKRMIARAALVAAATAATAVVVAGPALAYPPGTDPVVTTSAGGYTSGTAIPVSISNIAPGCQVQFTVSLNGQTVASTTSTTNKHGNANATIPGQQTAGAYTVTAHGVPSASNPDCASGDVSTIVVVSSNGANSGSTGSPASNPVTTTATQDTGILGSITGALTGAVDYLSANPRVRNLIFIAVVAAAGFWFFIAWRRRHEGEQPAAVEVPGGNDPPTT
jgi:hypothetical protein